MTLVQEAHKEHGRKRSLTQVKADWHQAAKRVCRIIGDGSRVIQWFTAVTMAASTDVVGKLNALANIRERMKAAAKQATAQDIRKDGAANSEVLQDQHVAV